MYCPNCAKEVNPDLSYCNSCGFRLQNAGSKDEKSIASTLAQSVPWVAIFGLMFLVILVKMMLDRSIDPPIIVVVTALFLGCVFGICAFAMKYARSLVLEEKLPQANIDQRPVMMPQRDTNQLEEARTPPASVTDHTTRTLEKVPAENER